MIFQSPQSISKNIENENIFLSQSLILNQNCQPYSNHYPINSKYYMETPHQTNVHPNNYNIYNDYKIDNSFNKDTSYKGISSSIKAELRNSSNNFNSLINTPQFEKICHKIFFPKEDPFHLSSTKKTPNIIENKKRRKSPLINEKENKISINLNINNINCNQSTKMKMNVNLLSSQTKKKNKSCSNSISNSHDDIKNNSSKNKKNVRNFSKIINLPENKEYSNNSKKYTIKRKNKFADELKALLENNKNERNNLGEDISSVSSTKVKSTNTSEIKIKKNIIKNKNKKKKLNIRERYSKRSKKYNILTVEIKKKLLVDAKHMRTIDVARKYGISTRNINRWKKIGIKRKRGSGRKFKDPDLEKKMIIWYNIQNKKNITAKAFREKALELSNNNSFRASSGWLTIMKKKYHIKFKNK